jgi:hypothetical protein
VDTGSTWFTVAQNPGPRDDGDAEYTLTVRVLTSSIRTSDTASGTIGAIIENSGSVVSEPVLEASDAYLISHRGSFLRTGLPTVIEMAVPPNAATLSVRLRSEDPEIHGELYLYDCTTGECFSYNIGFPAAGAHTLVVRKPNAGRWVAAVNPAPYPAAPGSFVLDEIVAKEVSVRRALPAPIPPGGQWRESIDKPPAPPTPPAAAGRTPVLLLELVDEALQRAETQHPWSTVAQFKLRDRPVAVGTAVYRR